MIRFSYDLRFKRAFAETLDSWLSTPDTTRSFAIYSRDTPNMVLNKTSDSFHNIRFWRFGRRNHLFEDPWFVLFQMTARLGCNQHKIDLGIGHDASRYLLSL
jgi:hypothetical protein